MAPAFGARGHGLSHDITFNGKVPSSSGQRFKISRRLRAANEARPKCQWNLLMLNFATALLPQAAAQSERARWLLKGRRLCTQKQESGWFSAWEIVVLWMWVLTSLVLGNLVAEELCWISKRPGSGTAQVESPSQSLEDQSLLTLDMHVIKIEQCHDWPGKVNTDAGGMFYSACSPFKDSAPVTGSMFGPFHWRAGKWFFRVRCGHVRHVGAAWTPKRSCFRRGFLNNMLKAVSSMSVARSGKRFFW